MAGEKFDDARAAIERFVNDLLDDDDELFCIGSATIRRWCKKAGRRTTDQIARAMARIANGGTSLYDAIMESLPSPSAANTQKCAPVVISDGNDTSASRTSTDVGHAFCNSEVIIRVRIDGVDTEIFRRQAPDPRVPQRTPPSPRSPFGRRPVVAAYPSPQFGQGGGGRVPYHQRRPRQCRRASRALTDRERERAAAAPKSSARSRPESCHGQSRRRAQRHCSGHNVEHAARRTLAHHLGSKRSIARTRSRPGVVSGSLSWQLRFSASPTCPYRRPGAPDQPLAGRQHPRPSCASQGHERARPLARPPNLPRLVRQPPPLATSPATFRHSPGVVAICR